MASISEPRDLPRLVAFTQRLAVQSTRSTAFDRRIIAFALKISACENGALGSHLHFV